MTLKYYFNHNELFYHNLSILYFAISLKLKNQADFNFS